MKKSAHSAAASMSVPPVAFARSDIGQKLAAVMEEGSPSQRRFAEFVLRNPLRLAAWSIDDAARQSGISAPTISRFARELGYAGFAELRSAIAGTLHTLVQSVEKLRERIEDKSPGNDGFSVARANLAQVDSCVGPEQVASVTRRLVEASAIYVMGFGISAHLAALLTLGIQPYCRQVVNVVEYGGTEVAAGRLATIGKGDVLFAITFPRYANDVVHLSRYARDQQAHVIALSDSVASPLARYAHELLVAPSDHPVLSSSAVAAVAVIEAICASVMVSDRENIARAARLTEAISSYLLQPDS
ncbi:MurR/RpiR family transcriptional regulator [Microvirga splendida]|uniref:MurR/RpiR family transcriptional regulator n=1 Tax=Microvirga splendida TaxID=2795727 RepID=A0ABS0Y4V3_9HYPH|nr:MurR/RpiR family transcriptional regulator [Microvirga splendida]MBJ6127307.1 MurR/RpiR family transcriptional regulator [Microvirga splendida]